MPLFSWERSVRPPVDTPTKPYRDTDTKLTEDTQLPKGDTDIKHIKLDITDTDLPVDTVTEGEELATANIPIVANYTMATVIQNEGSSDIALKVAIDTDIDQVVRDIAKMVEPIDMDSGLGITTVVAADSSLLRTSFGVDEMVKLSQTLMLLRCDRCRLKIESTICSFFVCADFVNVDLYMIVKKFNQ